MKFTLEEIQRFLTWLGGPPSASRRPRRKAGFSEAELQALVREAEAHVRRITATTFKLIGLETWIRHIPAPPVGMVQRCARCGLVLQDYSQSPMYRSPIVDMMNLQPGWWEGQVFISFDRGPFWRADAYRYHPSKVLVTSEAPGVWEDCGGGIVHGN